MVDKSHYQTINEARFKTSLEVSMDGVCEILDASRRLREGIEESLLQIRIDEESEAQESEAEESEAQYLKQELEDIENNMSHATERLQENVNNLRCNDIFTILCNFKEMVVAIYKLNQGRSSVEISIVFKFITESLATICNTDMFKQRQLDGITRLGEWNDSNYEETINAAIECFRPVRDPTNPFLSYSDEEPNNQAETNTIRRLFWDLEKNLYSGEGFDGIFNSIHEIIEALKEYEKFAIDEKEEYVSKMQTFLELDYWSNTDFEKGRQNVLGCTNAILARMN